MEFKDNKIVIINVKPEYLQYLSCIDSEIHFDDNNNYENKPHVGILLTHDKYEYVIPLTSAKEKHKTWGDTGSGWIRVFEIIDIRSYIRRNNDIIVDIRNNDLIKNVLPMERSFYKQRILSVLDIRKMFPVFDNVFNVTPMRISGNMKQEDINRYNLLMKEFLFLTDRKTTIETKATKIYNKQMETGKILKYHCNYKLLESACDSYQKENG